MHRRMLWPLLAVAAVPFVLAARSLADGVTYSFTMTSTQTDDRGRSRDINSMSGKAQVTSTHARMDVEAARNQPGFERGDYMIMRASPSTFYMVSPRKREYLEFSVDNMARGLMGGATVPGGMIRMEVTDLKTSGEKVGSGGEVNGQQTELYRVTQEYGFSMRVMGRTNRTTTKSVTDYYVAPALRGLVNPMMRFGQSMASAMPGGDGGGLQSLMDEATAEQQRLFRDGSPVRVVTKVTSTDERGRTSEMVSTMDMTDIRRTDVPDSAFELPAGYKRIALEEVTAEEPAAQEERPRGNPLRRAIPRP
jgi:hypothetical protein